MIADELEKYLTLKRSSLFETIDFSFLTEISELFQNRKSSPGEILFDPSRDRAALYIIQEGGLVDDAGIAYKSIVGVKDILLMHFENKNFNRKLLSGSEGCILYAADGRSFMDLIQEIPEIAAQFISLREN